MNKSFLQSTEWQKFQNSLGRETFVIEEKDIFNALIMTHKLPFDKTYYYCPRGPAIDNKYINSDTIYLKALNTIIQEIKQKAKQDNSIFFKIEPQWINKEQISDILIQAGFNKSEKNIQAKDTLILDIAKPEQQLLNEMKQKTRYSIRLAQKKKIQIVCINKPTSADIDILWNLIEQTTKRKGFKSHGKEYYTKQFEFSNKDFFNKLFIAFYQNQPAAANVVNFYQKTATYLYGASSDEHKNLMAPYLLQWEQIIAAQKLGMQKYDFWGICPNDQKNSKEFEKWKGFTRFKQGFGGKEVRYIGSWEYALDKKWYMIYKLAKKFS